jgi:hypothetical protein
VVVNPGEVITREVSIVSRIDKPTRFRLTTEDFVGADNAKDAVKLLGDDRSPYSFKDNLIPEVKEFTLKFGEQIKMPISIRVPKNAQPGGFYASLIVVNDPEDSGIEINGTRSVSRLAQLFFVRVRGAAEESGALDDLRILGGKSVYQSGPITFQILFKNTGTVHLVPHGNIIIKNLAGTVIETLPVDAYFAMPKSLRYRDVEWVGGSLFGRYTATAEIYRGYGEGTDSKTIAFWILPTQMILICIGIALFLILVVYFFRKTFELKRKHE